MTTLFSIKIRSPFHILSPITTFESSWWLAKTINESCQFLFLINNALNTTDGCSHRNVKDCIWGELIYRAPLSRTFCKEGCVGWPNHLSYSLCKLWLVIRLISLSQNICSAKLSAYWVYEISPRCLLGPGANFTVLLIADKIAYQKEICLAYFFGFQPNFDTKCMHFGW